MLYNSVICSAHFCEEDYSECELNKHKIGLKKICCRTINKQMSKECHEWGVAATTARRFLLLKDDQPLLISADLLPSFFSFFFFFHCYCCFFSNLIYKIKLVTIEEEKTENKQRARQSTLSRIITTGTPLKNRYLKGKPNHKHQLRSPGEKIQYHEEHIQKSKQFTAKRFNCFRWFSEWNGPSAARTLVLSVAAKIQYSETHFRKSPKNHK